MMKKLHNHSTYIEKPVSKGLVFLFLTLKDVENSFKVSFKNRHLNRHLILLKTRKSLWERLSRYFGGPSGTRTLDPLIKSQLL